MPLSSPYGMHRVLAPEGVLPQAAQRLDASPEIRPSELRVALEKLNLDAASYRQLARAHTRGDGTVDGAAVRAQVLDIIATRGKMQNPVTGSGGMLIGTVDAVGAEHPGPFTVGDRVATLVSLSLTPLTVTDGLAGWDGLGERVPARGSAILFARTVAARLPPDLDPELSLMVMDVCGAPALVARVVAEHRDRTGAAPSVTVLGGAGKSGSLSLAAAGEAGARHRTAVVPTSAEARLVQGADLADDVVVADARSATGLVEALEQRSRAATADVTVVCVDVPGCEQPAILTTAQGGTVVFFSMATSFAAAALGAEGLAADVRLLIGNGYVPGHAEMALRLVRDHAGVRALFERRLAGEQTRGS